MWVAGYGCIGVDKTRKKSGELLEIVGGKSTDRGWRAQQDRVHGSDRAVPSGRKRDKLTAPVIGVRAALDQAVRFQLVHDERGVRRIDAVGVGKLTKGRRSIAELEEGFSSAAAEAETKRLGEFGASVLDFDELLHERPCLLLCCDVHHATVRPR